MIFEIVAKVLGATELNDSEFPSEGLSFSLQRTGDGKVKATVTPCRKVRRPRSSCVGR